MSDFTYANLISSSNKETAKAFLEADAYLLDFSDKWSCLLTRNDTAVNIADKKGFSETILSLSEKIPVLYFLHAEDHGLGFLILHNRNIVSSFEIDWGHYADLSRIIAEEMYGDEGFDKWMKDFDKFEDLALERRQEYISKLFFEIHPENFSLFGFPSDDIAKINETLNPKSVSTESDITVMINALIAILGLEEFTFVSWDYVKKQEKAYPIIAKG